MLVVLDELLPLFVVCDSDCVVVDELPLSVVESDDDFSVVEVEPDSVDDSDGVDVELEPELEVVEVDSFVVDDELSESVVDDWPFVDVLPDAYMIINLNFIKAKFNFEQIKYEIKTLKQPFLMG